MTSSRTYCAGHRRGVNSLVKYVRLGIEAPKDVRCYRGEVTGEVPGKKKGRDSSVRLDIHVRSGGRFWIPDDVFRSRICDGANRASGAIVPLT